MPLFHVGGSGYAQAGIHGGAATILLREPAPAALFGAIASGATHTFVVDLPRNATGKVLKRTLPEPYWAGRERSI
jgi:hypothetical protein